MAINRPGYNYPELEQLGLEGEFWPETTKAFRSLYIKPLSLLFPGLEDFFDDLRNVDGWERNSVAFFNRHFYVFAIALALYLPVIFGIQRYMRDRPPFELRVPLIAWNWVMCLFSLWGTWYCFPSFIPSLMESGWWGSLCTRWCFSYNAAAFLVFLFDVSKICEFVDTLFVVLRKKKLIFLHYYHHVSTMSFCWYANQSCAAIGCHGFYFAGMNFFVHFIMYLYYALMAMRIRMPPFVSTCITSLQILQMVFGMLIVLSQAVCEDMNDPAVFKTVTFGFLLYLSFFLLFAEFFYFRYFVGRPAPTKDEKKDK
jgi:elongation of very long chain fatty acids protein 6